MPIDTQTFGLTRWWSQTCLELIQKNKNIFSNSNLRVARREFIAGKNQISAIKNWLNAAKIIKKNGTSYELSRYGQLIVKNDRNLKKSSTWWAFHLLICFGDDPFPYDAFFRSLDPNIKQFTSLGNIKTFLSNNSDGMSLASIDTYFSGVLKMFAEDGTLQGLGIIESRKTFQSGQAESFYKLSSPEVSDSSILFALALAREKYFKGRPTIDFGELINIGLNNFLSLSQDDLKKRINLISHTTEWRDEISFNDVANINSVSFGDRFNDERMLVSLLQDGADSWM